MASLMAIIVDSSCRGPCASMFAITKRAFDTNKLKFLSPLLVLAHLSALGMYYERPDSCGPVHFFTNLSRAVSIFDSRCLFSLRAFTYCARLPYAYTHACERSARGAKWAVLRSERAPCAERASELTAGR